MTMATNTGLRRAYSVWAIFYDTMDLRFPDGAFDKTVLHPLRKPRAARGVARAP